MSLVDLGKNLLESAKIGETEEVRKLMTSGAPFTTDWLGTSPLHLAAQYGHVETAEVLLRAGISRDARTKVERTPLHVAAQEGHLEIVELLLKHGADIEAKDMLKMTALHWAVERGHLDVINCLLSNNANVCSASKFFKTPIDIASDNCRPDIVQLLNSHGGTIGVVKGTVKHQPLKVASNLNPIILKPLIQKLAVNNKGNTVSNININNASSKKGAQNSKNKPLILQANLANLQKSGVTLDALEKGDTEVEEDSDSSTSVLATLAALAEATAPNANISTADTLQWLETHGIQMLPADNSTIVSSALEGGQSISLTEAGKLALNWVKDHQNMLNKNENLKKNSNTTNLSKNQKLYTIVTDESQLSVGSGQNVPIMLVQSTGQNDTNELVQTLSFQKTSEGKKIKNIMSSDAIKEEIEDEEDIIDEREKLRLELEAVKREAEEYKAQLIKKEHEAEQYKKQLEEMQCSK